jgi:hypothetical protein
MSRRHVELMEAIGMAGALVPTYREGTIKDINPRVEKTLNRIDQRVVSAMWHFGAVGKENLQWIEDRIDKAHQERNILGRARSILTFIDYAIWLLESTMSGEKPPANIKGKCGRIHIQRIIDALVDFRIELAGKRDFTMCSVAGIKAAERYAAL